MVKQVPYVQYTHARAPSVLRKADTDIDELDIDYSLLTDSSSVEVIKLIDNTLIKF